MTTPKTIVELHSLTPGARVGKAFHRKAGREGWHKSGAGCNAKHWRTLCHAVEGLEGLAETLPLIAARGGNGSVVVLDAPREGVDTRRMLRRGVERDDSKATLAQRDVQFVMLDIDDLAAAEAGVNAEALAAAVAEGGEAARAALREAEALVAAYMLPETWQGCGFLAHWSGSAGVGGWGSLKIHLWVETEAPVCRESLKRVFEARNAAGFPAVDTALWRPAQIHHVADPVFKGGDDPLAGLRWSLHPGRPVPLDLGDGFVLEDLATHTARVLREEEEEEARRRADLEHYKRGARRRGPSVGDDLPTGNACYRVSLAAATTQLDNAVDAIAGAGPGGRHDAVMTWCKTIGGWIDATYEDDHGVMQPLLPFGPEVLDRLIKAGEYAYGGAGAAKRANLYQTAKGAFEAGRKEPFSRTRAEVAAFEARTSASPAEMARKYQRRAKTLRDADALSHIIPALREIGRRGGEIRVPRGRYHSPEDVANLAGVRTIYLPGVHGTGKTTLAKILVAAAEGSVLCVVPRQTLAADVARRLGLEHYQDIKGRIDLAKHPRVVVCLDSLCRIDFDQDSAPALLLIDESDQVTQHLYGQTIAKSRLTTSLAIYRQMRRLIEMSDLTVAADADLSERTLELCRGRRDTPEDCRSELVVAHPYRHQLRLRMYAKRPDLRLRLRHFMEAKKRGETIAALCTTLAETKAITAEYSACGFKVLCINSETAQHDEEVQAFLADPAVGEGKYDLIVASPTLGTGVSVDWQVSRLFLFGQHVQGITAEAIIQQGWRFRDVKEGCWHAWIQQRRDVLPTTWDEVDALGRVSGGDGHAVYARVGGGGARLPAHWHDQAHWSLWCTTRAAQNRSCSNVLARFLELAASHGWTIEDAPDADEAERKAERARRREIADQLNAEKYSRTYDADAIDEELADRLLAAGGVESEQQRYELLRSQVARAVDLDYETGQQRVSLSLIEEYCKGRSRRGKAAAMLRLLFTAGAEHDPHQEAARAAIGAITANAIRKGSWELQEGDGLRVTRALTAARMLQAMGINPFNADQWLDASKLLTPEDQRYCWSEESLRARGLIEWVERNMRRVRRLIGYRQDWRENLNWVIGRVLAQLGCDRVRRQVTQPDGKRVSVYHLDLAQLAKARRWEEAPYERLLRVGRDAIDDDELGDIDFLEERARAAQVSSYQADTDPPVQTLPSPEDVQSAAAAAALAYPFGVPSFGDLVEMVAGGLDCSQAEARRALAGLRTPSESPEAFIDRISLAA